MTGTLNTAAFGMQHFNPLHRTLDPLVGTWLVVATLKLQVAESWPEHRGMTWQGLSTQMESSQQSSVCRETTNLYSMDSWMRKPEPEPED